MLPTEMNAILCEQPGGPEQLVLGRQPVPTPKPDEVLIRVQAAGVNRPDLAQRRGTYPPPPGANPGLGLEVAGEIVAAGPDVFGLALGQSVCALTNGGGYAEYAAVPFGQCLPFPTGYTAIQAAALPETSFTVWANLFDLGQLKSGETALVHGGSSGIGTTAIQYAVALGARIIVTAGSDAKCEACRALGATAINYRNEDFAVAIQRLTEGRGVDAILDMVGGGYFPRNLASLAFGGRLVFIAFLSGAKTSDQIDLGVIQRKRLTITGSALRPRTAPDKAAIADKLRRVVWPILDAGRAAPIIQATFPLEQAAEAHRALEKGDHVGKFVLTVGH